MKEFSLELSVDMQHLQDAVRGLISTIFFYRAFGPIIPKTNEFLDIPYPFFDLPELEEYIESKIDLLMSKIGSSDTPLLSSSSTPFGSPPTLKFLNNNNSINNNPYANLRISEDDDPLNASGVVSSMPNSPLKTINTNTSTIEPTAHSISNLRSPRLNPYNSPGSRNSVQSPGNNQNQPPNMKYSQIVINFYELKKLKKPSWFGKIEEEVNFEVWLINIRTLKTFGGQDRDNTIVEDPFSSESLKTNFERLVWNISEIADQNKDHLPIISSTEVLPFNYSISIKTSGSNDSWKEFIKKMLKEPIL